MLKKHRRENSEHSNPYSYSWSILRLAIMKLSQNQLQEFINVAGIEMQGTELKKNCIFFFYCKFIYLFI